MTYMELIRELIRLREQEEFDLNQPAQIGILRGEKDQTLTTYYGVEGIHGGVIYDTLPAW